MLDNHVLAKIQKLLSLSRSSNEHEAAVALMMAQKLMTKYGVTVSDISVSLIGEQQISIMTGLKDRTVVSILLNVIDNVFGVKSIIFSSYKGKGSRSSLDKVSIIGLKDHLDVATYAFIFLSRQIVNVKKQYTEELINEFMLMIFNEYNLNALSGVYTQDSMRSFVLKAYRGEIRQRTKAYILGWLQKVRENIQEYSFDDDELKHLQKYISLNYSDLTTAKSRRMKWSFNQVKAYNQGLEDAKNFKLLQGLKGQVQDKLAFKR